ncbi:MAG TPA: PfkB family carbohydrate kinase [Vicinamibacteria bacterium]|nr:PfkB family carbohydrate kinase [Vicinamibacteria bacterium]
MAAAVKPTPHPPATGPAPRYRRLVGVGGIGAGIFFVLEGTHELGRNESRPGRLLDVRDYCKLHIVAHYPAVLLGARPEGSPFLVLPVGKVGIDEVGLRLRAEMSQAGMDTRFVDTLPGRPTLLSVCFQYPDGSGGNITTIDSAAALLAAKDVDRALAWVDRETLALAVPEVPLAARLHLLRRATERGAFRAASLTSAEVAEARQAGLLELVDLLALNEDEAAAIAGVPFPAGAETSFLRRCAEATGAGVRLIVTAGARGAFAFDGESWTQARALPVPVVNTAGAGDALLGGVLTGLAAGLPFLDHGSRRAGLADRPLTSAFDLGILLAAFKVTSPHTIPPGLSPAVLAAFVREHGLTLGAGLRRLLAAEGSPEHAHER